MLVLEDVGWDEEGRGRGALARLTGAGFFREGLTFFSQALSSERLDEAQEQPSSLQLS